MQVRYVGGCLDYGGGGWCGGISNSNSFGWYIVDASGNKLVQSES